MRNPRLSFTSIMCAAISLFGITPHAQAQLWLQFAHPANPHSYFNDPQVPIIVPALFANTAAVVRLPVLVILLQFTNLSAQSAHNSAYFADLVFGRQRPNGQPSVAETYRENSNGRLVLVPATAGDTSDGAADGIVGWLTAQGGSPPGSYTYYSQHIEEKRAEAIRRADPFFDYGRYDANGDHVITSDELLILVVNADSASGANTRQTVPRRVAVEGGQYQVYQYVAGVTELAHVGLIAHEFGHQAFGLEDLYAVAPNACHAYQQVVDGYLCNNATDWYPPDPARYSLMGGGDPASFVSHLDPWAKIHLGFVKPLVVTHDGTYTLYNVETDRGFAAQTSQPEAIIIYDPLRTRPYKEYFVLENRDRQNRYLATNQLVLGRGLAVWLINEGETNLRKVIRLIRRGGHWAGELQSLWDGVNETDGYDLTSASVPRNTNWTDGSPSYIEIYDVSVAGPAMTLTIRMPSIFVDRSNMGVEYGSQADPFNTVWEGVTLTHGASRTIRLAGGRYPENLTLDTPMTLVGWRSGDARIGK
jgi:M6 family metalloprotease-like protein